MTNVKDTKSRKGKVGAYIIGNAIVWGAVMIGVALVLRGTDYMARILPILGGGAGFSVVILSSLLLGKKTD